MLAGMENVKDPLDKVTKNRVSAVCSLLQLLCAVQHETAQTQMNGREVKDSNLCG